MKRLRFEQILFTKTKVVLNQNNIILHAKIATKTSENYYPTLCV